MSGTTSLTSIVDDLSEANDGQTMSVGEIVDAFGHRGFGALLGVPALISISPLGAIPGASLIIAVLLVLVGAQLAAGRKNPWLPGFLRDRTVSADRVDRGTTFMRRWSERIDRWLHRRLEMFVSGPANRLMAAASVLLALSFLPVILIPWAVVMPSLIILLFAVAIIARDGLSALVGWVLCPLWLWLFWRFTMIAA